MGARCEDFVARFDKTPCDYAYTDSLTDTDWAWEFLRRNREYSADYYESRARPAKVTTHPSGVRIYRARGYHYTAKRWGLAVFADPNLNALQTDIFWSQEVLNHCVAASSLSAETADQGTDLDLFRDHNCTAILCDAKRQKVIVRSQNTAIDMKLVGTSALFQPVRLRFHLNGFASVRNGARALIWTRNALKSLRAADKRALTKTIRSNRKKYLVALDCNLKGASLRDTALVFRALRLTRLSWSTSGDEALKKQVWRARNSGLKLMNKGYRKLL